MAMVVQEAEVLFSAKGMEKVRRSSGMAGKAMDALTSRARFAAGAVGSISKAALGFGAAGFAGAVAGGAAMLKLAADAETLSTQFEVLTGSQEKTAKLMDEIDQAAAKTPFQKMDIANAVKSLIAFNGSADTAVDEVKMLGDISAATGQPIGELAELYGKAKVQGRLFGEDINQLTGRGIPIIQALADEFGVAENEVKNLVAGGKVGFPEMQRALAGMTGPGGKFAGMMETLSGTTAGKFSTFVDNVKLLGTEMGEELLPYANDFLDFATEGIEKAGGFSDVFGTAIETAGSWYNDITGYVQDVGVIAGVVVDDFDLMWSGLFKDMVSYAKQAFDWILANSGKMIRNLIEMAKNAPSILDNTGRAIGEEVAFQLGMSDEKLEFDPLAGVRMEQLSKFDFEHSDEMKELLGNVDAALEKSRAQRKAAEAATAKEAVEPESTSPADAAQQAFVSREKTVTGKKTEAKATAAKAERGSATSVFNRIQDQLANKEMELQKEQLKEQTAIKEAVQETTAAVAKGFGMGFVPVLG